MTGGWAGRRVLVTGGAGFLGSGVCQALGRLGAVVTAVDAMLPGTGARADNLEGSGARLVRGDVRDVAWGALLEGVDVVFNFAAQTGHLRGQEEPLDDLATNAMAQLRLILALRAAAPGAVVVHASTRQFYGAPRYLPVDEAHPVAPADANGVSKFAGETYWLQEARLHGRRVVALRLTNCYGPRLRVVDAAQTFVGIWVRRVLEGGTFEVWGGAQLRDLAYLDDVVDAALLAAVTPGCAGRAFNLGGAAPVSLLELAERLVAANEGRGGYVVRGFPAARAAIDIGSYHADDRAFRAATGWAPRVGLDEGLRRTLDWFRPRLAERVGEAGA